jgi:hypothetical protein
VHYGQSIQNKVPDLIIVCTWNAREIACVLKKEVHSTLSTQTCSTIHCGCSTMRSDNHAADYLLLSDGMMISLLAAPMMIDMNGPDIEAVGEVKTLILESVDTRRIAR